MSIVTEALQKTQLAAAAPNYHQAVDHLAAAAELAREAGLRALGDEVPEAFGAHPDLVAAFHEGRAASVDV